MSKKKKKKILQGMEHLYQNLTPETSVSGLNSTNNIKADDNNLELLQNQEIYLKKELLFIIFIMIILFGILALILYFDKSSDFLRILAEKLTSFY